MSGLSFSPSLSHWLWSGGTDVRGRGVATETGATVAFQEDDSWYDEAEHQQQQNQEGQRVEIKIRRIQNHQLFKTG